MGGGVLCNCCTSFFPRTGDLLLLAEAGRTGFDLPLAGLSLWVPVTDDFSFAGLLRFVRAAPVLPIFPLLVYRDGRLVGMVTVKISL